MKLIDCVNKKANVSHKIHSFDPILFLFLLFPFFSFAFSMKVNRERGESESYEAMNGR